MDPVIKGMHNAEQELAGIREKLQTICKMHGEYAFEALCSLQDMTNHWAEHIDAKDPEELELEEIIEVIVMSLGLNQLKLWTTESPASFYPQED